MHDEVRLRPVGKLSSGEAAERMYDRPYRIGAGDRRQAAFWAERHGIHDDSDS